MKGQRILVVDDEPQILRFLRPALAAAGYEVIEADTGKQALALVATAVPDLLILDLGLPDMDGKEVIAQLRHWNPIPIIVLSARDREVEKIAALDLGADDYLEKPFGIGELTARIRVALRHKPQAEPAPSIIRSGELVIDIDHRLVTRADQPVKLTPKEYDLLRLLATHAGRVLTHGALLKEVWGPAHAHDLQYLRVFIRQIRAKIEKDESQPAIILTEAGVGYRFVLA
ncbi:MULTISPECIES: response regulator [Rhizobium/Agrobacterium group]|uniref:Two component response regulator n=2 Tax=Rhizobium/Agrobacterium group TaxID=227290 RepID=B9K2H9_ALLAM|nr:MULTISPECIES: response regulator [Rhizobium/Agrobacterium group]ACM39077.1 two component response regulator [Allorhizobium ampelinum S4]MCF1445226.1 response regulator [Allorhizobium ampelinum]MUO30894.1 response regulator [Agrobacterium vitis]MUO40659.1 response regulator [Agrobacterium vitis]MUP08286.1 response regulator [Agrobacterium vitis]